MKLKDSFTIPADRERSWQLLLDLPAVARCLPGAQLLNVDGETCTGTVKVKIGPIVMTYQGELEFTERDPVAGVTAMRARGKDKRGAGTVSGTMRLVETSSTPQETSFTLDADLDITGKPAQFGRGAIQDVASRLIGQFAQNLATLVDEDEAAATTPDGVPAPSAVEGRSTTGSRSEAIQGGQNGEPFDLLGGNDRTVAAAAVVAAIVVVSLAWVWYRHRARRGML